MQLPLTGEDYPATTGKQGNASNLSTSGGSDGYIRRLRDWPLARSKSHYRRTPGMAGWTQGRNIYFRCPFHRERTPSCVWVSRKRIFHCFGCGKAGTAMLLVHALNHRPPDPEPWGEVLPMTPRQQCDDSIPF